MKNLTLPMSLLALILTVGSFFFKSSMSDPVYVDINKLMDGYNRTQIVRAEFEEKAKTLNANVDSLMVEWQTELKQYEKERSKMSKKEMGLKQELLGNKQRQISNYQQAIQKQIEEADQKATQTVINDINDYVKEFGKKNGYKIIFGARGSGNIMYAAEGTDLTKIVLEGINADFEGTK